MSSFLVKPAASEPPHAVMPIPSVPNPKRHARLSRTCCYYTTTPNPAASAAPQYDDEGRVLPPRHAFELGDAWLNPALNSCADSKLVVEVLFCAYCQMGYIYHRTVKWYNDMDAVVCMSACCLDVMFLGVGYTAVSWWLRDRIRKRYRIRESCAETCALATCCAPCSLCQIHREMISRGEHPGGVYIVSPCPAPPPPMMSMSMPNGGASPNAMPYTHTMYYTTAPGQPAHHGCPSEQTPYSPRQGSAFADVEAGGCTPSGGVCGNGSQVYGGSYPTTPSETKNGTPAREGSPAQGGR